MIGEGGTFSALRILKSYLKSTFMAERLNQLSILNIHCDLVPKIKIDVVIDEFICRAHVRMSTCT